MVSGTRQELLDGEVAPGSAVSPGNARSPVASVVLSVRGCGRFGAYSSQKPLKCILDSVDTEFSDDLASGLLTLMIPVPAKKMHRWNLEIHV